MDVYDPRVFVSTQLSLASAHLGREVVISCFVPREPDPAVLPDILFINDGQHAAAMDLGGMLSRGISLGSWRPLACFAIHAGPDRLMEYGVAGQADYKGRGARAAAYAAFVLEELLPFVEREWRLPATARKSFAGFSLGGLSALDIVWNHPQVFSMAGVFSGSLWWRVRDLEDGYCEETDRIMHAQVRGGRFHPGLRFFFETGTQDETMDRNNNGIIDSIDDTLGLMDELVAKGYDRHSDMYYLELADGRHDIDTWARALPMFLEWGWG